MAANRQPSRGVLTTENANSYVGRTGSYKPYNESLAAYAAVSSSKAHQLKIAAQDAAAALEHAKPEPGAVMSLNDFSRQGILRSAVDQSKADANYAEKIAKKNALKAQQEAIKRLESEKDPKIAAARLKKLINASYANMKEEARVREESARVREEAARVQAEEARRARNASYAAAERAASNARIAAAGQAERARVEAEIAREAEARRVRKGGKGSYHKKRTIRSKKYMNYKRKTHRRRK